MKTLTVLAEVLKARQHQLDAGYTPEHDLDHISGELAAAAFAYIADSGNPDDPIPLYWAFERESFHRIQDPYTRCIEAIALLLAEAERLLTLKNPE